MALGFPGSLALGMPPSNAEVPNRGPSNIKIEMT